MTKFSTHQDLAQLAPSPKTASRSRKLAQSSITNANRRIPVAWERPTVKENGTVLVRGQKTPLSGKTVVRTSLRLVPSIDDKGNEVDRIQFTSFGLPLDEATAWAPVGAPNWRMRHLCTAAAFQEIYLSQLKDLQELRAEGKEPVIERLWNQVRGPSLIEEAIEVGNYHFTPTLNGANGEWTGSDDVKGKKGGKGKKQPKPRRMPRQTTRAKPRTMPRQVPWGLPALSDCAGKYALALADPFDSRASGVCVPTFPAINSQKFSGKCRFTFAANGSGVGFANIMPAVCSDYFSAHFSTGTWAGNTNSSNIASDTLNTSTAYTQVPYTGLDFTDGMSARIVAVGVRVTYVGTVTNMSGLIQVTVSPDHQNLNTLSTDELTALPQTQTMRVSADSVFCCTGGVSPQEFEYVNNDHGTAAVVPAIYQFSNGDHYSTAGVDNVVGGCPITVRVRAAVPGITFYVEVITHYEFYGPSISLLGTQSHVDPTGFAIVSAAQSRIPTRITGTDAKQGSYKALFSRVLAEVAEGMRPSAHSFGAGLGKIGLALGGRLVSGALANSAAGSLLLA